MLQFKDAYAKAMLLDLQSELESCKDADDAFFYKKDIQFHMYFIE